MINDCNWKIGCSLNLDKTTQNMYKIFEQLYAPQRLNETTQVVLDFI